MTQKRAIRVVATSARLIVGMLVALGCVAGAIAGAAWAWPEIGNEPAQVAVTPTAGDTTLVCAGDFRALGRDTQNAAQLNSAGTPALTVDGNTAREDSTLSVADLPEGPAGPQKFVVGAEDGSIPLLAAAESLTLAAEDLAGLAGSACREPSTESWLVGGAVVTGTSDVIVLANPGDVAATVTLTVFGDVEPSTSTMALPADTQLALPLASVAAGLQAPVVRVTAAGAPVRATLQSALIRTLDPSGIDLQDSAGAPSSELTFAGVQVVTPTGEDGLAVVRLMSTGDASTAAVTVRDASGGIVQNLTMPLEAGIPTEVGLAELEPGVYSVDVHSDSAIVGALKQTTRLGAGSDFAWMTPAPQIDSDVFVSVPDGPAPRIQLVNAGDQELTVLLAPTTGATGQTVTVPAGGASVIDAAAATTYAISADGPFRAAVMLSGTDALAGWPVWPSAAAQADITVYP